MSILSPIAVVFAINDPYTNPLLVTLVSLFEHAHTDTVYAVYVLNYKLQSNNRRRIEQLVSEHHSQGSVTFLDLSDEQWEKIPYVNKWGKETNFRLFLPDLVPHLDKIIYMDVDILVMGDLQILANLNLTSKAFAGVSSVHANGEQWKRLRRWAIAKLDRDEDFSFKVYGHCNAGVLVINLDFWRTHNFSHESVRLLKLCKDVPGMLPDEDVLNYLAMRDGVMNVYFLPKVFNTSPALTSDKALILGELAYDKANTSLVNEWVSDETLLNITDIQIIHFAANSPWHNTQHSSYNRALYQSYADKIGWKLPGKRAATIANFKTWLAGWGKKEKAMAIFCFSLGLVLTSVIAWLI